MNAPEELLMLMQDGTPYTLAEICDATGMRPTFARNAIYRLMTSGLVSSKPVCYQVTPEAAPRVQQVRQGGRIQWKGDPRA